MDNAVRRIVIVGGGSAGWLVAGTIAAEHGNGEAGVQITLIESPDIKLVGVGEGTWPTMRTTLRKMGISETEFVRECDVAFKQASKFCKWYTGEEDDEYYHPFTLPVGYTEMNLAEHWKPHRDEISFSDAVCIQSQLCGKNMGPKFITSPEYGSVANYSYHLDASKFALFLRKHCIEKLGIEHISDNVLGVNSTENGDIRSLNTQQNGELHGDLFVDCTGLASLLIGKHYQIPMVSKKEFLFNDAALAAQVPYLDPECPISSNTISTAQSAGWIWDIGLQTRRGVGYVYSRTHISDEAADKEFRDYLTLTIGREKAEATEFQKIKFNPGHREVFWKNNCVAVGLAAGFIEPLEASAIILIELSARMISEQLPADRNAMTIVAKRFNEVFTYRWNHIINFLKLHYVLSKRRGSQYWIDHCDSNSIPESLQELLELWRYQAPWFYDEVHSEELFPCASFQYILYGMGYETAQRPAPKKHNPAAVARAHELFGENIKKTNEVMKVMPTHRELINKINRYGLQKI
jgi:tryptophan halogenase